MSFLQDMMSMPGVITIVMCNSNYYNYSSNSNRWNRKQCNSNRKQCNSNLSITFLLHYKNHIKIPFHYVVMHKYQPDCVLFFT